jgi:hypothetical protein
MATQDDDTLMGAVPEPGADPTPAELAHARRFAELVDKTLSGRTPPAMSADDRALLEAATVIRAAHGRVELAASTERALVEDVLRQAVGAPRLQVSAARPVARASVRRHAPWLVAGAASLVAAAAVVALWLRTPDKLVAPEAAEPAEWRSRPADALVGPIARERAGAAGSRIDEIFADRLEGFRARQLTRGGRR